eukprot:c42450_g1_i1 orf=39-212(+)
MMGLQSLQTDLSPPFEMRQIKPQLRKPPKEPNSSTSWKALKRSEPTRSQNCRKNLGE